MRYLSTLLFIVFLVTGSTLQGQVAPPAQPDLLKSEEVTDAQVEKFADAMQTVQKIQQESQPKMLQAIQEVGLNPQQFIQAAQALQQGKETGLNEEDQEKFETVQKKVQEIQVEANGQIEAKIKEQDLTLQKFNQLFLSYQQNQELQERINEQLQPSDK